MGHLANNRRTKGLLALLLVLALISAACGDDGSNAGATPDDGAAETAPRSGGVLTFGQFSNPPGLDPALLVGGGTVGGNEAAAMYDTLMRYDSETQQYEGRTAESLTPNDDFTVWTMKIRPDIRFTDGTPYDAHAVKFVLDREMTDGNASVRGKLLQFVSPETVTVVDDLTLRFELKQAWTDFPYLFTGVPGLVYSPTAFEAAGSPENFAINPGDAGAGPFKLKAYKPGEMIEFERNPDYWGGDVSLDGLRFILLPGPAATFEGLEGDVLDAAFVRDPEVVDKAKAKGYGSLDMPAIAGNMALMNSGIVVTCASGKPEPVCAGRADGEQAPTVTATSNRNVRLAVSYAVDPETINERVYGGTATPNSAPFANSPSDPGVDGIEPDMEEARRLVEVAKSEGWNGTIRVLAGDDPVSSSWAIAVSTMLESAGMEVTVDTSQPISGVVSKVLVQRDFDIVSWGPGWAPESAINYLQLMGAFHSSAPRYGYSSPEMDAAIDLLRTAVDEEDRVEAYREISKIWVRDVPAHVITVIPQSTLFTPEVHGLVTTGDLITLFHDAWIES